MVVEAVVVANEDSNFVLTDHLHGYGGVVHGGSFWRFFPMPGWTGLSIIRRRYCCRVGGSWRLFHAWKASLQASESPNVEALSRTQPIHLQAP